MRRRRRHVLGLRPTGLRQLGWHRVGLARRRRHGWRFARWCSSSRSPWIKECPPVGGHPLMHQDQALFVSFCCWLAGLLARLLVGLLVAADFGAAAARAVGARAAAGHGPVGTAAGCGPWDRSSLALHGFATTPGIGRRHSRNVPLTERVARGFVHPGQPSHKIWRQHEQNFCTRRARGLLRRLPATAGPHRTIARQWKSADGNNDGVLAGPEADRYLAYYRVRAHVTPVDGASRSRTS